ncbi:MAG: rhodanese-related sulfurtransferase [Polyangiales bacterium]|jgi:rhodanese-related sulfurtransferase
MQATAKITKHSTMQEILEAYPSAQRALFSRYHIGGCNGCGYEPEDILEKVANSRKINDLDKVIAFIEQAEQVDQQLQMSPGDVAAALESNTPVRVIDVRTSKEWELARIQGATLNTQDLAQEMMRWPKDTLIVFYCHFGQRSLDAASYFAGHGFSNVRMMTGGIDAWSLSEDSSVPRYEVPSSDGKAMLRTLRSVVSKASGCQNQNQNQETVQ